MNKFKYPKFKRGSFVVAAGQIGVITAIEWHSGKHWYEVHGKFFAENELSVPK